MLKKQSKRRTPGSRCAPLWFALLCCLLWPGTLHAQDAPDAPAEQSPVEEPAEQEQPPATPPTPQRNGVTAKAIQEQISGLEQVEDPEESTTAALELLRKALQSVQQADDDAARTLEYQQTVQGVPDRLKALEQRQAQPIEEPEIAPGEKSIEQIRQELSAAQATLDAAKQARLNAEQETTTRTQRREQIPQEIATLRGEIDEIEQRLAAPPAEGAAPVLVEAQRTKLQADRKRVQQRISMLEEELRSYDARRDTMRLRRQVVERNVQEAERLVQAWQAALSAREQQEATRLAQQAKEAQEEAEEIHPLVAELAETNREYARERTELVPKVERATAELSSVSSTLQRLRDDFRSVQSRVEQTGMTSTIGLLLRNKRALLPEVAVHERNLRERGAEINRVQLLRSELEDELLRLVNLEATAEALMGAREDIPPAMVDRVREATIEQLRRRKEEFIPGLIVSLDAYLEDTLVPLDQAEAQLIALLRKYNTYIDERILWIRSANPVSLETVKETVEASQWVFSARHWRGLVGALWDDFKSNWSTVTLKLLLLAFLAVLQRVSRRRIDAIATEIRSFRTDTLGRTFAALGLTALCVIVVPTFLWFVSQRLMVASDTMGDDLATFARAASEGLSRAAWFLLVALSLWYLCMPRGLAEAHFRWRVSSMKLIRRNLLWLIPVALPVIFLLGLLESQPSESYKASLGRAAMFVLAIALTVFLARVLRPSGGILHGYLGRKAGGWIDRLRFVWYPAAVGVPLALAIASLAGYHYTAVQLGRTVNKTVALIIGATVLHALLVRWLLVAQRKLAMEQARKRKAAQAEAAATSSAGPGPTSAGPGEAAAQVGTQTPSDMAVEVPDMDISQIGDQTRRLMLLGVWFALILGLWAAWTDVLPALGVLRQVELAQQVQTITETVVGEDGAVTVETVDRLVAITLADVLLSILAIVLTVIAVRNIPGLLEITLLQRLPLVPSGRYAVSTICKYVIIIVGLVVAFNLIGIGWSKVQWLAAAITVGLGFGLQEIFANFVSGIIILFEQPIRVGDIVTINDISGTVTRIRMRATTIRDWDRKELVIPNKVFVTDNIVNWTLSDTVLRIRVPVGIAYGSNTELARQTLLETARTHPLVLKDPEPQAWFSGFGDSTLDFELRVFIGSIDHLLEVRHAMYHAVDQAFRKAGVEIAFPQRDLHIRSGLEQFMQRPDSAKRDDTAPDPTS